MCGKGDRIVKREGLHVQNKKSRRPTPTEMRAVVDRDAHDYVDRASAARESGAEKVGNLEREGRVVCP